MVRVNIQHAENLEDLYGQLVAGQQEAHGAFYCEHHQTIRQAARNGARSYCELGVNQGATLACALLAGFEQVAGVDMAPENWRPFGVLFRACPAFAGVYPQDHLAPLPFAPDFLLLDCLHTAAGLREELRVHGPTVKRRICIHDTTSHPHLGREARRWALANQWTVKLHDTCGHGHTLLERIK